MDKDLVQLRSLAVASRFVFGWFNDESDIRNANQADRAFILECSPTSIVNLIDNFEATEAVLQKAIDFHSETEGSDKYCSHCGTVYPCKTLRILTGEDNG